MLENMITHYKNNGERVDEVLFQEVMKAVEQLKGNDGMSVADIRAQFIDLHKELLNARSEIKQLREEKSLHYTLAYPAIEVKDTDSVTERLKDIESIFDPHEREYGLEREDYEWLIEQVHKLVLSVNVWKEDLTEKEAWEETARNYFRENISLKGENEFLKTALLMVNVSEESSTSTRAIVENALNYKKKTY